MTSTATSLAEVMQDDMSTDSRDPEEVAMTTSLPLYVMDRILSEKWIDIPSAPDRALTGRTSGTDALTQLTRAFPDLKVTIEDVLQAGNKVIVRSEIAGTQRAPFMGLAAKNRKIAIQVIDMHEFRRGRLVRTWHAEDWLTGFLQLGLFETSREAKVGARRK